MADPENGAEPQSADDAQRQPQQQPNVKMQVLAQYVRDMSFENVLMQKGGRAEGQPDISVQVNMEPRKRSADHQYEVIIKTRIESRAKETAEPIFLLELEYGGIFHIENVPDEQLHPFLMIECPRMIFPYLRRIVSDVTRDGGYPPLNLENIDFIQLYRNEIARRQAAQQAEAPKADA